ncbi:ABC transporter ATP-binding protein [Crenothrix sp.]|uniref:ABC transporter ATP-binding protein n=1 Tax=Crenothrix sp. TaxID=3100433 RepID=UPI00374CA485
MLFVQILAAISEVVSLGAVIPFLGALANAPQLLANPILLPWLVLLHIENAKDLITWMAGLFAIAFVVSNLFRLLAVRIQYRYSAIIGSDLSAEVYRRTLYQPYSFHIRNSSSDIISLSMADANNVSVGLLPSAFYFVTNTLVVIAIAITLIVINPWVALGGATLVGGAYGLIMMYSHATLVRNGKLISELDAKSVKAIQEGLGGIRDVLIDGSQPVFDKIYRSVNREALQAKTSNSLIAVSPRFLIEPIAMMSIAGLAVAMSRDSTGLDGILPLLGTLAVGANRLLPALQQCFVSLAGMRNNQASLWKVITGLSRPMVEPESIERKPLLFKKTLSFEKVWFSYEESAQKWILQDLNLVIPANTTVAFVGSTGSGKSTTADLILGLLQAQKGHIKVDGVSLNATNMRNWQATIAHVPQHIYLSDTTLAENIAFGVPIDQIDMDRVCDAARLAQIADFIETLPNGYQNKVGERGTRLSGGQRQRIGIARALYKQASVIVFDEATSALDNTTEQEVMAAIESLSHKVTIILIAHRLSTIRSADIVFELPTGKVVTQNDPDLKPQIGYVA